MNIWLTASLWVGLALIAAMISIRVGISVALVEIGVGVLAGNFLHLTPNDWVNFLAGVGSVLLTFLAGAEIDPDALRANLKESLLIGFSSFLAPALGAFAVAFWIFKWNLHGAEIAGIALSTTSVAVVYAVMIESGLNETELGKAILASCFVTDLGTVVALGLIFANYNRWLLIFAVADGCDPLESAGVHGMVLSKSGQPGQRTGGQVHPFPSFRAGWAGDGGEERSGASSLPYRVGHGSPVPPQSNPDAPDESHCLLHPDPLLLHQGRLVRIFQGSRCRPGPDRSIFRLEDDHQSLWRPAVHPDVWIRKATRHLHHTS